MITFFILSALAFASANSTQKGESLAGGINYVCPDVNHNTDRQGGDPNHSGRVGAEWTNDVKSWEDCSALCQKRSDCRYWTWHHGNSGSWAYKCVTMIDVWGKAYDTNVVSG